MNPPPVHDPMQQSKAGDHGGYLPAVRGWDGEPETGHCSLFKCCGNGSCDCKQGWCVAQLEAQRALYACLIADLAHMIK